MPNLDDLAVARRIGAQDERARIVAEVRSIAENVRALTFTSTAGAAIGAVVDEVADRIAAMPDEEYP